MMQWRTNSHYYLTKETQWRRWPRLLLVTTRGWENYNNNNNNNISRYQASININTCITLPSHQRQWHIIYFGQGCSSCVERITRPEVVVVMTTTAMYEKTQQSTKNTINPKVVVVVVVVVEWIHNVYLVVGEEERWYIVIVVVKQLLTII